MSAQTIKQITPNKFEIDSAAVKATAALVLKQESNTEIIKQYEKLKVKDNETIATQDSIIVKYQANEASHKSMLDVTNEQNTLIVEKWKTEANRQKWKAAKAYTAAGVIVVTTIVVAIIAK